jgi:excisionase family DNA binding protein
MKDGDWVTVTEAARLLGVHRNTVRNRVKAGRYKAHKVVTPQGETVMLSRESLGIPLDNNPPQPRASSVNGMPSRRASRREKPRSRTSLVTSIASLSQPRSPGGNSGSGSGTRRRGMLEHGTRTLRESSRAKTGTNDVARSATTPP